MKNKNKQKKKDKTWIIVLLIIALIVGISLYIYYFWDHTVFRSNSIIEKIVECKNETVYKPCDDCICNGWQLKGIEQIGLNKTEVDKILEAGEGHIITVIYKQEIRNTLPRINISDFKCISWNKEICVTEFVDEIKYIDTNKICLEWAKRENISDEDYLYHGIPCINLTTTYKEIIMPKSNITEEWLFLNCKLLERKQCLGWDMTCIPKEVWKCEDYIVTRK